MKKKVLIVEDDFIIQMYLESLIEKEGCEVVACVSKGEQALVQIKELKPDLVFMDVGIAGKISGIEVASKVNDCCKTPIVFMTGNSDKTTLAAAQATNPLHILFKPIDEEAFSKELKIILLKV